MRLLKEALRRRRGAAFVGFGVERQCGGNRAPSWSPTRRCRCSPRAAGYQQTGPEISVAKSSKTLRWLLTVVEGGDYIRLTNEGGTPLATKKFASKPARCEIQESRVSDTRTAPEPKAKRATTLRLRCLFFEN